MKRLLPFLTALLLIGCSAPITDTPQPTTTTPTEATEITTEVTFAATIPTESTEVSLETTVPQEFNPYDIVDTLSVEELVGQMFLARCPSDDTAVMHIQTYHLGGYILFGRDFEAQTPSSVSATIAAYQSASVIPMLISVDEEGGSVCRVSGNIAFRENRFLSPRNLFDTGGLELIAETELEKCQLLCSVGINVNMAPVCDVTNNPDAFMYSRSLGQSPEITGQFVETVISVMSEQSIGCVLKHFPGYGNNTDTHTGIAIDDRSLEELQNADLVPFQAGIQAGCDAILVSHTLVNCLDTEFPASLSPAVVGYLRNEMRFEGVIVTDDLVMQAITDQYGTGEAAVLAVLAGNDLLCSSEYPTQYQAVLEAVQSGRISIGQVRDSAARIIQWKYDLGLLTDF